MLIFQDSYDPHSSKSKPLSDDSDNLNLNNIEDLHIYDVISNLTKIQSSTPKESMKKDGNEKILRKILQNVQVLVNKKDLESKDEDVITEWKTFAKLIDRVIFLICLVILLILIFSFLD